MTSVLLNVLAAASLVGAGVGATSETRSAQSLPVQHLTATHAAVPSAVNSRGVNRLADASPDNPGSDPDRNSCKRGGGHWDSEKDRCLKGAWLWGNGARLLIGAGTAAGIIVAVTEHESPVSN